MGGVRVGANKGRRERGGGVGVGGGGGGGGGGRGGGGEERRPVLTAPAGAPARWRRVWGDNNISRLTFAPHYQLHICSSCSLIFLPEFRCDTLNAKVQVCNQL